MKKVNHETYPEFHAPDRGTIAVMKQLEDMQETNLAILESIRQNRTFFKVLNDIFDSIVFNTMRLLRFIKRVVLRLYYG